MDHQCATGLTTSENEFSGRQPGIQPHQLLAIKWKNSQLSELTETSSGFSVKLPWEV